MFSLIQTFFSSFRFQPAQGGGKDLSSLPSSPTLSFMFFFAFVDVQLEVYLALLTTLEVLFIVLYNLSLVSWLLQYCAGLTLFLVRRPLPGHSK
jgi:hypothetical protein